ncbi:MAG: 5'-methylthioadenosine/S-adenosylhomocysteine nucleosidase [Lachnospiraceae bacterium]|nr:5'-methylthioadenosine/S-adenosylhomocysteine nucleosidase [Lachnospiraceae bacterium]
MKKTVLAFLLAGSMTLSMTAISFAEETEVSTEAETAADTAMEEMTEAVTEAAGSYLTDCYDPNGPILLEGAMSLETSEMIAALENAEEMYVGPYYCVSGTYKGYPVVVLRTEQESANAGASTALAIEKFHPCAVINQGTSGGHDPELHTFDIVLGKNSVASSAWKSTPSAEGEGVDYKAIEMQGVYSYDPEAGEFTEKVDYPCDEELLAAAESVTDTYTEGTIIEGVISTSNEWNNQIDRMLYLHELTGSSCEEMETNAAAQMCANYGIPFIGIRILSNTGIYGEDFNPETGAACQGYVLNVAEAYMAAKAE